MDINSKIIRDKLTENGLKVTPQRMAILQAIYDLDNHPTADKIVEYINKIHPNIATGTVYKVLGVLEDNALIKRVKSDKGTMRYDGMMESHHHIYCTESDLISDYIDEDLDQILKEYFEKKNLPGFKIEDIVLQIKGKSNT